MHCCAVTGYPAGARGYNLLSAQLETALRECGRGTAARSDQGREQTERGCHGQHAPFIDDAPWSRLRLIRSQRRHLQKQICPRHENVQQCQRPVKELYCYTRGTTTVVEIILQQKSPTTDFVGVPTDPCLQNVVFPPRTVPPCPWTVHVM